MQILQWLCKRSHELERKRTTKTEEEFSDEDIILVDHRELSHGTKKNEERKLIGCKTLKIFAFTCRKDIPKASFYSSLNLKRLASLNRRMNLVDPMKMKKEELSIGIGMANNKADSEEQVRKKLLHVTEATFKNSETKSHKKNGVSRIKELIRWAEKGGKFKGQKVVQLRRRGTVKAIDEDDEEISGPITSSSATSDHVARRKGNWITSDSEFVVLEL